MSFESPPSVSGIVVLSGSNDFSAISSDFPVVKGLVSQTYTASNPALYGSIIPRTKEVTQIVVSGSRVNLVVAGYTSTVMHGEISPRVNEVIQIVASGSVRNLVATSYTHTPILYAGAYVVGPSDWRVTQTEITTSGIVLLEMALGIGAEYFIPIVFDARVFPISTATFPVAVSGTRIYPVLPQYSTIIP